MGLLDFIMSGGMTKEARERRERTDAYSREMKAHWAEYRPKLEQARERWGNYQKEVYKTTGQILVPEAETARNNPDMPDAEDDEGDTDADIAEYEAIADEISYEGEKLSKDIETYKNDKADAISHYANPE